MGYIPNTKKTLELKKIQKDNKKEDLIRKKNRNKMFTEWRNNNPNKPTTDFLFKT